MAKAGACSARSSTARSGISRLSAGAKPHPGAQEFLRVDRFAVDPGFVVQMRTSRSAGRSDGADHLANSDPVADLHADLGQMAVAGRQTIAVVDFHHSPIAAGPTRRHYFALRGRPHRIAGRRAEIETGVHGRSAEERIVADPEAGSEFDFAYHRLAIRHQRQRPAEALHLGAVNVDPVELALESPGVGSKF